MIRLFPVLFLFTLLGCQDAGHPAQGKWQGVLIHNGVRTDLGRVFIGDDRIDMPEIDESYRNLAFYVEGRELRFSRNVSGSFQGETSGSGRSQTAGVIRMNGENRAELSINRIQGLVALIR